MATDHVVARRGATDAAIHRVGAQHVLDAGSDGFAVVPHAVIEHDRSAAAWRDRGPQLVAPRIGVEPRATADAIGRVVEIELDREVRTHIVGGHIRAIAVNAERLTIAIAGTRETAD